MALNETIENCLESQNAVPPLHRGTRYDAAGTFLVEPGNTVICRLMPDAPSTEALLALRSQLTSIPGAADHLAFTAPASLHMTLFQGVVEYRRKVPFWPRDLPLETPIEDMTDLFLARLSHFQAPPPVLRMTPVALAPSGLTLAPLDDESDECLRLWRDRLAALLGYRHPDHDTYRYHITFAYFRSWLPDYIGGLWQGLLDDLLEELQQTTPVIGLAAPAFCAFETMNHFEELLVLE